MSTQKNYILRVLRGMTYHLSMHYVSSLQWQHTQKKLRVFQTFSISFDLNIHGFYLIEEIINIF